MRKSIAIAVAAVGTVVLTGGIAYAVVPGPVPEPDGTIHMCYNKTNGSIIKVVTPSTGMDCSGSEGKVIWNQTGPQGEPGPQGIPGPTGPQGEPGEPAGLDVYYVESPSLFSTPASNWMMGTASCEPGDKPLGGGSQTFGLGWANMRLVNALVDNGDTNGWRVVYFNESTTSSFQFSVFVTCLDQTP